jgi:hypothetical protein|tara:strand:- start:412 stop:597 length:186 start_codon:yes stop_codon:yes gene_type:complete
MPNNVGTEVIQDVLEEWRSLQASASKNAPKLGAERPPRKHANGPIQKVLKQAGIRASDLKG